MFAKYIKTCFGLTLQLAILCNNRKMILLYVCVCFKEQQIHSSSYFPPYRKHLEYKYFTLQEYSSKELGIPSTPIFSL